MNSKMSWSLILVFSAFVAGGCAAAATRVTIDPSPGRPEAQVRADGARCAEAASAVTTSLESVRTREYAACLMAQGYRITMPFQAGGPARALLSGPGPCLRSVRGGIAPGAVAIRAPGSSGIAAIVDHAMKAKGVRTGYSDREGAVGVLEPYVHEERDA
jgi:hypothetical protein